MKVHVNIGKHSRNVQILLIFNSISFSTYHEKKYLLNFIIADKKK